MSIRDVQIGDEDIRGISGGQRKRVNVGMELVANPTVLFLDEPTSGLDSAGSKSLCQCLRSISELGLNIAAVIHQPRYEIFCMFHDVLLLGKGGKTVYLGPTEQAAEYFESLGMMDTIAATITATATATATAADEPTMLNGIDCMHVLTHA
jgi:ABC-type multidrug transport system ATPase subunit